MESSSPLLLHIGTQYPMSHDTCHSKHGGYVHPNVCKPEPFPHEWNGHTLYVHSMELGTPGWSDIPYIPTKIILGPLLLHKKGLEWIMSTYCYFDYLHYKGDNYRSRLGIANDLHMLNIWMTTHIHYGSWLFLWYTKCGHHRFVHSIHATSVCERNSTWQGGQNKYFIIVKSRRMVLHLMHVNTIKSIDAKLYLELLTLCLFQCIHNVPSKGNRIRVHTSRTSILSNSTDAKSYLECFLHFVCFNASTMFNPEAIKLGWLGGCYGVHFIYRGMWRNPLIWRLALDSVDWTLLEGNNNISERSTIG